MEKKVPKLTFWQSLKKYTDLYKTMKAFGICPVFVHWIRQIYSNATTQFAINGFLSENIPLKVASSRGGPFFTFYYRNSRVTIPKNPDITRNKKSLFPVPARVRFFETVTRSACLTPFPLSPNFGKAFSQLDQCTVTCPK